MKVKGKHDEYEVGELVAECDEYRLRKCVLGDRELLFQIATDQKHNPTLARSAWALKRLAGASDDIEAEYKSIGGEGALNYDMGFPEVLESFVFAEQGSRQVNILGFRFVDKLGSVVPIVKLPKQSLRVDLRTSAWILGKLLKTIMFAHDNRFEIGAVSCNNVLIQLDHHFVFVFDWSKVVLHDGPVPASIRRGEVKAAAQCAIKALGGDLERAREDEADLRYTKYVQLLATSGESDAGKAHQTFYEIVDGLCEDPDSVWKKGFYPSVTLPLEK